MNFCRKRGVFALKWPYFVEKEVFLGWFGPKSVYFLEFGAEICDAMPWIFSLKSLFLPQITIKYLFFGEFMAI